MKRVLFVDHVSRILGGAEINLVELLSSAWPREWEFACACQPGSPLSGALGGLPVSQHPYSLPAAAAQMRIVGRRLAPLRLLRGALALRRAGQALSKVLDAFKPHAVISCTNKDHFCAGLACQRSAAPSLWWVNDLVTTEFFSWPAVWSFFREARRHATRLVVVSDFCGAALERGGLPRNRIVTIHNGIPLQRYRRADSALLRTQLGLGTEVPLIGLVGRFTPWKGQSFFLELARAWTGAGKQGHFLLIGRAFNEEQAFETSLHEFVRVNGLTARVHFIPFQQDIAQVLSDLDVLVHASLKPEPFGRVIIEGMAVGVPVVAAGVGGVPEIISDGVNGFLAEPGSVKSYTAALGELLGMPERAREVADAGKRTVAERFSIEIVQARFQGLVTAVS